MKPPLRPPVSAFSLIEMLVVIAIIGLLAVFTLPAVGSLMDSSKLNTSVNQIADQIALARQTAVAQSRRVEVRFYKLTNSNASEAAFRGIRASVISDTGVSQPLTTVRELAAPVIISEAASQNTVFRQTPISYAGTEDLPKMANAPYFKFSFLPNGRTDFASGEHPFLTIFSSRDGTNSVLPKNYAVLQLDAMTGNIRIFRPNN